MSSVNFSSGLPSTVLPADPLDASFADLDAPSTEEVSGLVARYPRSLIGWATLGELAGEPLVKYAFFRVGYHRGLDSLRAAGWRGSGYVRWDQPTNRGFLRCVEGLRSAAEAIGETDEAERCGQFLQQLDPDWLRR